MKKSDKIAYHQKDVAALKQGLMALHTQIAQLQIQHQLGNLKDTSSISKTKKEIAIIETIIKEKANER